MPEKKTFPDTPNYTDLQADVERERPATNAEFVRELSKMVEQQFGRVIPQPIIRAIVEGGFEFAFRETARTGTFRLPNGWGVLRLKWIKGSAAPRTSLVGERKVLGKREDTPVIRLNEGAQIRSLLRKQTDAQFKRTTARRTYFNEPKDPA